MSYEFVGSCPSLPAWFVDWVAEDAEPEEIEFQEVEERIGSTDAFQAYMAYRLEESRGPKLHPAGDWSVSFSKGETPLGRPFVVIQDSGIENVYIVPPFDLQEEEAYAEKQGLGFHFEKSFKKLKARLLK